MVPLPPIAVRLPPGAAEELVRLVKAIDAEAVAVGPDVLAGPGPALVGALARITAVIVDTRIAGPVAGIAPAVSSLAGFGAAAVTISAMAGETALATALEAVRGRRTQVVAAAVTPDVKAGVAVFGTKDSVGKVVSRAARTAAGAGVPAMLTEVEHLGVVAEVAPEMRRLAVAASIDVADDALRRGASTVLLDLALGGLGTDRARTAVAEALGTVSDTA
jgi:orotidine-5'-phosphate decarboxylase